MPNSELQTVGPWGAGCVRDAVAGDGDEAADGGRGMTCSGEVLRGLMPSHRGGRGAPRRALRRPAAPVQTTGALRARRRFLLVCGHGWVRCICRHGNVASTFQSSDNQFLWELIGGPPKTRNMSACWQDGRFFAENETWVVDSCTKCTCKVRRGDACPLRAERPVWVAALLASLVSHGTCEPRRETQCGDLSEAPASPTALH